MKKIKIYCCFQALVESTTDTLLDMDKLKSDIETILSGETPFKLVNVRQLYQKEIKEKGGIRHEE